MTVMLADISNDTSSVLARTPAQHQQGCQLCDDNVSQHRDWADTSRMRAMMPAQGHRRQSGAGGGASTRAKILSTIGPGWTRVPRTQTRSLSFHRHLLQDRRQPPLAVSLWNALVTSRSPLGTMTKAATQPQQIMGTTWSNIQVRTGLIDNDGRQWFVDGCRQ